MAPPRITRRTMLGSGLALPLLGLTPARATPGADGFRAVEAAPAALRLRPEPAAETQIWAYDGVSPGPLLRCRKGEEIRVRLVNRLQQPTSLTWPGIRIANAMDGVGGLTQKPVAPGDSFDYRFTPPDSGLFAYRPGLAPFAAEQLARGLYGALIVDEASPPFADKDMVAVIADWRLDGDGAVAADFDADLRGSAALITVNGAPAPVAAALAPGARVRLRLVSASAARIMSLTLEGAQPFILAVDGQPADAAFEPVRQTFPVGPGARFDIMFDLPREDNATVRLVLRGEPQTALLTLRAEGEPRAALPPIASLERNPALPAAIRLQDAKRAQLVIAPAVAPAGKPQWTLNGVAADRLPDKPLFALRRGTPVTLAIVNRSSLIQPIHLHGHHLRLLHDLDDGWEPYWRDSVLIAAGKTKHVAFVADNPGKWLIESMIPERAASGLATWFFVS